MLLQPYLPSHIHTATHTKSHPSTHTHNRTHKQGKAEEKGLNQTPLIHFIWKAQLFKHPSGDAPFKVSLAKTSLLGILTVKEISFLANFTKAYLAFPVSMVETVGGKGLVIGMQKAVLWCLPFPGSEL